MLVLLDDIRYVPTESNKRCDLFRFYADFENRKLRDEIMLIIVHICGICFFVVVGFAF